MSSYPHLTKAPIKEALIDIQVKMPNEIDFDKTKEFGNLIHDEYPTKTKRFRTTFGIKPSGGLVGPPERQLIGWKFTSVDGMQIVQARLDGFTFSRLKKYEDWSRLKEESSRLWSIYLDFFHPTSIDRIGCRYINEIRLKHPIDLQEYLSRSPGSPVGSPDIFASFISRVVIPYHEYNTTAIITQAFEKVLADGTAPIIIDIDVFMQEVNEAQIEIWEVLDNFRNIKNQIFFGSITPKTVEMYR